VTALVAVVLAMLLWTGAVFWLGVHVGLACAPDGTEDTA
jgi:hypothetical protein